MLETRRFAPFVCLLASVGCSHEPTDKNIPVTPRLVVLHSFYAEREIQVFNTSGGWYSHLDIAEYFQPTVSDVLKIDKDLRKYLEEVANRNIERSHIIPHWKSGILEIRARQNEYLGQFVGVRTTDGKSVIISFYSHIALCDLDDQALASLLFVPWGADSGAANFTFNYDATDKRFYGFHVNGTQPGPFGSGSIYYWPDAK